MDEFEKRLQNGQKKLGITPPTSGVPNTPQNVSTPTQPVNEFEQRLQRGQNILKQQTAQPAATSAAQQQSWGDWAGQKLQGVKEFFVGTDKNELQIDEKLKPTVINTANEIEAKTKENEIKLNQEKVDWFKSQIDRPEWSESDRKKIAEMTSENVNSIVNNGFMFAQAVDSELIRKTDKFNDEVRNKIDEWNNRKEVIDITKKKVEEVTGKKRANIGFIGQIVNWENWKEELATLNPATAFTDSEVAKAKRYEEITNKIKNNQPVTQEEREFADSVLAGQLNDLLDNGAGESVANVVTMMTVLVADNAVSTLLLNPVGNVGKQTLKATKFYNKASKFVKGVELTTDGVYTSFKISKKLPPEVMKKVASEMTENFVRLNVTGQVGIGSYTRLDRATADYMLPTIDYENYLKSEGKNGDILAYTKKGDDEMTAAKKARIQQFIESSTESLGVLIDKPLPFIQKAFVGKWLKKKGIDPSDTDAVQKALKTAGINSIIAEIAEEEIGQPFSDWVDGTTYNAPFLTKEGNERLLVTTLGIGAFKGIAGIPKFTLDSLKNKDEKKAVVDVTLAAEEPKKGNVTTVFPPDDGGGGGADADAGGITGFIQDVSPKVRDAFAPTTTPTEGFVTPPQTQPMVTPEQPATTPQVAPTTTPKTKPTVTPTPAEKPAKKSIKQVKKETKQENQRAFQSAVDELYDSVPSDQVKTLAKENFSMFNLPQKDFKKLFDEVGEMRKKRQQDFDLEIADQNILSDPRIEQYESTIRQAVALLNMDKQEKTYEDLDKLTKAVPRLDEALDAFEKMGKPITSLSQLKSLYKETIKERKKVKSIKREQKQEEKAKPKKKLGQKKVKKKEVKKPAKKVGEKKVVTKQPNPITVKAGTVFDQANSNEASQNRVNNAHKVMQNVLFGKEISSSKLNELKIIYQTNKNVNSGKFKDQLKYNYTPIIDLLSINPDTPKIKSFQNKMQSIVKTLEKGGYDERIVINNINQVLQQYNLHIDKKIEKYINKRTPKFRLTENLFFKEGTNRLTTKTAEVFQTFKQNFLTKAQMEKFLKDANSKYGISQEEVNIIKDLLANEYQNVDEISLSDLNQKIIEELLPIQIFERDTTSRLGSIFNLGRDSLNLTDENRYKSKVIVLNSPYNHGKIYTHLGGRFDDLNFYELERDRVGVTDPEFARTMPEGLFSWARVIIDTETNEVYIIELQSDPFQDTSTGGNDNIDTQIGINKEIADVLEKIRKYNEGLKTTENNITLINEKIKELQEKEVTSDSEKESRDFSISEYEKRLKQETKMIDYYKVEIQTQENIVNVLRKMKPSKEEKMHLTYLYSWHKRSIKELIRHFAEQGYSAVNIATPITVAQGEQHIIYKPDVTRPPENVEDYKIVEANDKELLKIGDLVKFDKYGDEKWIIVKLKGNTFQAVLESDIDIKTKDEYLEEHATSALKQRGINELFDIWKNIYGINNYGDIQPTLDKIKQVRLNITENTANLDSLKSDAKYIKGNIKYLEDLTDTKNKNIKDNEKLINKTSKIQNEEQFKDFVYEDMRAVFGGYTQSLTNVANRLISSFERNILKKYEMGEVTAQEYVDADIFKDYDDYLEFFESIKYNYEEDYQVRKFNNTVDFIYKGNIQKDVLSDIKNAFEESNSIIKDFNDETEEQINSTKERLAKLEKRIKEVEDEGYDIEEDIKKFPKGLQEEYNKTKDLNIPAFERKFFDIDNGVISDIIYVAKNTFPKDEINNVSLEKIKDDIKQTYKNLEATRIEESRNDYVIPIPETNNVIRTYGAISSNPNKFGLTPSAKRYFDSLDQADVSKKIEDDVYQYNIELNTMDVLNKLGAAPYVSNAIYEASGFREDMPVYDLQNIKSIRNGVFSKLFDNKTYTNIQTLFPEKSKKEANDLLNQNIEKIKEIKRTIEGLSKDKKPKSVSEVILNLKFDSIDFNRDKIVTDINPFLTSETTTRKREITKTVDGKKVKETVEEKIPNKLFIKDVNEQNQLIYIANLIRRLSHNIAAKHIEQRKWKLEKINKIDEKNIPNLTSEEKRNLDLTIQNTILNNLESFLNLDETRLPINRGTRDRFPIHVNYLNKFNDFFKNYRKDAKLGYSPSKYPFLRSEMTAEDLGKIKAYRKSQDAQITRKDVTDEQVKTIKKLNKKIFGDENVKFVQNILASMDALGAYGENFVYILSGQAQPTDTWLHEAVHKYIDIFMTPLEQKTLLTEAINKYKTTDMRVLEEKIAEDFIAFANARIQKTSTLLGKIQDFFEKLFVRTNSYFENLDAINKLYEEILSGKAAKIKAEREKAKKKTTKLGEKKAAQAPPEKKKLGAKKMPKVEAPAETVGQGKVKKSRFMERLNEQLLGTNPEAFGFNEIDGTYNVANLERESERAINFIEADPMRALNIALGNESAPAGYLENTIEVAVALRLKQLGNLDLYKQVLVRNSLKNTRRGQEIASLRGQFNDNSAENYIKRALDARLNKLGDKFAGGLGQRATMLGLKKSNKKEVFERIQKEKVELKKVIKDAKKIKSAQDIIDSLRC